MHVKRPIDSKALTGSSLLLLAPKLLLFLAFLLGPIAWGFALSMQDGSILGTQEFVGFDNYLRLAGDSLLFEVLGNTAIYCILVIPITLFVSLYLARLLSQPLRGRSVYRALLIVPTLTPTIAAVIAWNYFLQGESGVFNEVLRLLGMERVLWLGNEHLVMPMIAMIEIWRSVGFYTILFLAGIQGIPTSVVHAAELDGLTNGQIFRKITVPLLRPVVLFAAVTSVIFNVQVFDSPFALTKGGPGYASTTLVMYIYRQSFALDNMGYAAALSVVLLGVILAVAVGLLVTYRRDVQF